MTNFNWVKEIGITIKEVCLPFLSIIFFTSGAIFCGILSGNFGLKDLILQLGLAIVWTIMVYSIGILIRRNEEKNWVKYLYYIVGFIVMGSYYPLELYFIYSYAGLPFVL